jgi:SsrA-binding protein
MAKKKKATGPRAVAVNRKARHNYFITDTVEAGIMLTGPEVKSLRAGSASIGEAFASDRDGDLWLMNAHIPPYGPANAFHTDSPLRPRKLLLHKKQLSNYVGHKNRTGITVVPLSIYFNDRGIAKVELGIAKGKKQHDKRATDKDRDWQRDQGRIMRDKG